MRPTYDAFISYRSTDLTLAQAVHAFLADRGVAVWFDRRDIDPGDDWHARIEAGCEATRAVLAILTPRWQGSASTRYETYGHDQVILLLFEGELQDGAPAPLRRWQFFDMRATQEPGSD